MSFRTVENEKCGNILHTAFDRRRRERPELPFFIIWLICTSLDDLWGARGKLFFLSFLFLHWDVSWRVCFGEVADRMKRCEIVSYLSAIIDEKISSLADYKYSNHWLLGIASPLVKLQPPTTVEVLDNYNFMFIAREGNIRPERERRAKVRKINYQFNNWKICF